MSRIAKISVEKFESKDEILYDFDKSMGLDKNLLSICKKVDVPESTKIYGLMFMPVGRDNDDIEHYISESNYEEIKHNDRLKVVWSLQYILERIVKCLNSDNVDERQIAFEDIYKHSLDPVFIDELDRTGISKTILETFVEEQLPSKFQLGLLRTIVHLFSKDYIPNTSIDILSKCFSIMKITDTSTEEIRFVLSLLHKILLSPNEVFEPWKERILNEVLLNDIVVYMWYDTAPSLQLMSLSLINTIIKVCKSDKKDQIIRQLNQKMIRGRIYECVIEKGKLSKKMEHELYVLQTYLLNLFTVALNKMINTDNNTLFKREEFELGNEDMRRISILMDFDDTSLRNPVNNISIEDLAFKNRNSTISLASVLSDDSNRSVRSRRPISEHEPTENISYLTLEALRHYKGNHQKNFYQSQIEEQLYEPGIFITSERVIRMLTKILHIGVDPPESKSTFYQPLVFCCSTKTPFLLELFSRTMWLLSRTRREMKASSYADYEKVMHILRKQVKMALKTKPHDFKTLTIEMNNITFQTVQDKIMSDKEEEMKNMLENHPCLQELKEKFKGPNREHIIQHRIKCLVDGQQFIQIEDKKGPQDKKKYSVRLQLNKNLKEFTITDEKPKRSPVHYSIEDVTHIVIGKNCQHSNLCDTPSQAFCIIIKYEKQLQFKAEDEKTAAYWTDGFLLLTKKDTAENLSSFYKQDLNTMIEMDIRLQLVELQSIHIPKTPPVVPPLPPMPRPEVPPRPKNLKSNRNK